MLKIQDVDTFVAEPSRRSDQMDIIAEGIMPLKSRMVIGGAPKAGKTTIATQIALELASGTPVLGLFDVPRPVSVMMIQLELDEDSFRERMISARDTVYNLRPNMLAIITTGKLFLDTPEGSKELTEALNMFRPRVLVLDPLRKLHLGDEDNASHMIRLLNFLDNLRDSYGLSFIITHHAHKPRMDARGRVIDEGMDALRGSNAIAAWADSILMIQEHPNYPDNKILTFTLRHGLVDPVVLTPVQDKFIFTGQLQGQPIGSDEKTIVDILKSCVNQVADYDTLVASVSSKTGHSKRHVRRALSSLKKKALIAQSGDGRQKRNVYLLSPPRDTWFLLS